MPAAKETTTRKAVRHWPVSKAVLDARLAAPLARLVEALARVVKSDKTTTNPNISAPKIV
jgi:hypothetical protein